MTHPLSVTMAMESIQTTVSLMERLNKEYVKERAIRNNQIRDAVEAGVKYSALVRVTRLSRNQLNSIANSPREDVPE